MHLSTRCRTSLLLAQAFTYHSKLRLIPGHQDVSFNILLVAIKPAWVSWALSITFCRNLGGINGLVPLYTRSFSTNFPSFLINDNIFESLRIHAEAVLGISWLGKKMNSSGLLSVISLNFRPIKICRRQSMRYTWPMLLFKYYNTAVLLQTTFLTGRSPNVLF